MTMARERRAPAPGRRTLDAINAAKAARLDQIIRLVKLLVPVALALIALATGIFVGKR